MDISSSVELQPDAKKMPDTNSETPDMERKEPIASALAARTGGGVVLTIFNVVFPFNDPCNAADLEEVEDGDEYEASERERR